MNEQKLNDSLFEICQDIGKLAPIWAQGCGGSASIKHKENIAINANGVRLAEVNSQQKVSILNCQNFLKKLKKCIDLAGDQADQAYFELLKSDSAQPLPSSETGYHVLLEAEVVIHIHSIPSILMGFEFVNNKQKFQSFALDQLGFTPSFIPPCTPGAELSTLLAQQSQSEVYLLENHGVILQSDLESWKMDVEWWAAIETEFCNLFGYGKLLDETSLMKNVAKLKLKKRNFYFPESIIYDAQIKENIQETEQGHYSYIGDNLDCKEVWTASYLLEKYQPDLNVLDENITQRLLKSTY